MFEGSKNGIFAFDGFKLDVEKLILYRDGVEILLPAKIAKTLAVLVENAGSILSSRELIDRVWEDAIVEDSNLTNYIYVLRKTLGSMPDGRPYIETLRRRGYRFHGKVTVEPGTGALRHEQVKIQPPIPPQTHGVQREGNVLRVVEWKPAESLEEVSQSEMVPDTPPRNRLFRAVYTIGAVLVLGAAIASLAYFWPRASRPAIGTDARIEVSITRLTSGRTPLGGTISPDGNYFVYHEAEGESGRMFVQQVGQTSRIELEVSQAKVFWEKTFSPDGLFVYYAAASAPGATPGIYRIPTMGGTPTRLIESASSGVSFSPDGKEMVFVRFSADAKSSWLVIADRDGRNERILVERNEPVVIAETAAWSPDGKLIVLAVTAPGGLVKRGPFLLSVADVSTGEIRSISDERWDYVHRAMWLPDQAGVVLIGTREGESNSTRRDQVYLVEYPSGISRRLSTDGNRHEPDSLGVSRDGTLLAVSGNRSKRIYLVGSDGEASQAKQITRGVADGRAGLAPLPDGRIGFLTRNAEEMNVIVASGDGTDAKQLSIGFPFCEELRADPHGRFFIFSTVVDGQNHLFRMGTDGSDVRQLTSGESYEVDSGISPDGSWVAYDSGSFDGNVIRSAIFRKPSDGGDAVRLTEDCTKPTYSPDGSMISCVSSSSPQRVIVVSALNGKQIETHQLPAFATSNFGIGWTRDGRGLIYIASENGISNLWVLPRDGAKPRTLTNFTSGTISRYAFTPDHSRLYISRGYPIQDVVAFANYR